MYQLNHIIRWFLFDNTHQDVGYRLVPRKLSFEFEAWPHCISQDIVVEESWCLRSQTGASGIQMALEVFRRDQ